MKTFLYTLSLFLSLTLVLFTSGCSNDEEGPIQEIDIEVLPSDIHSFLTNNFPGLPAEKAEKINSTDSVSTCFYKVYLPYEITVAFNEEGAWQQVDVSQQTPQEQLSTFLGDAFSYIQTHHQQEEITTIRKREKGGTIIALTNNQKLVFTYLTSPYVGYEITKEELPYPIQNFISAHFADINYEEIIYKEKENDQDKGDFTYLIYLGNNMELRFNRSSDWILIEGNDQPLPASLIESLPEKVKEKLQSYPLNNITSMTFWYPEYHIKVSNTTTVVINPDAKPVVFPDQQISQFIQTHFGKLDRRKISHPLNEEKIIFIVSIPNGFDFTTDEQGEWFKINGHGYPVPASITATLPAKILMYINTHYEAEISQIEKTDQYLIVLTDETALTFDKESQIVQEESIRLSTQEKAYTYIRYHYPTDIEAYLDSWNADKGFTYRLENGEHVSFDREGNLIGH